MSQRINSIYFALMFFSFLALTSCGGNKNDDYSRLEKEKLDLEKRKLELEEAKFKAEKNKSKVDNSKLIETSSETKNPNTFPAETNKAYKYLMGKWTGRLRDKNFTIVIENIDGKSVTGYNVAGKNKRPLKGLIYEDDRMADGECGGMMETYKLVLSEPGDDKWDGVFTIYFSKCPEFDEDGNEVNISYFANGSWKANTGKLKGDVSVSK